MPKTSSTYATIHTAQDLIYALHNTSPERPLVKLGNGQKEALRSLGKIFRKVAPPEVTPRVPVREPYQEKLQQVNQKRIQMKISSQSNPLANVQPLKVTNVDTFS